LDPTMDYNVTAVIGYDPYDLYLVGWRPALPNAPSHLPRRASQSVSRHGVLSYPTHFRLARCIGPRGLASPDPASKDLPTRIKVSLLVTTNAYVY
ncbi:hypothetical protein HAX54_041902, partial [Datura stramonium]|nr:hypothetical protein [Datura stramonium]